MRKFKLLITLGFCSVLAACAAPETTLTTPNGDNSSIQLAEAAGSVSKSLESLEANQQAAHPPLAVSAQPAAATYGMQMPISIDWDGPIGPLVSKISKIAGYQPKVLGVVPPIPVIVSIHAQNTPLADILRNAGLQAGKRASIVVYPSTKVVELSYAPSTSNL